MSKSLVKISKLLGNVKTFPHLSIRRLCHSTVQIQEKSNDIKTEVHNVKELTTLINQDNNPSNIIRLIEINKDHIDGVHIVAALSSMLKFYQENNFSALEIEKSEQFSQMCSILRKNLRKLDLYGLIQSLKLLNLVEVPSSSFIMQSILQLIRCSINDLSLEQVYFLSFLLKRMEQTYLSEAILQSLPEVFLAQLEFQIDRESIKELNNALRYACDHKLDEKTIKFILDTISGHKKRMNTYQATSVLLSLLKIGNLSSNYLHLLNHVQNIIIKDSKLLETHVVKSLLFNIFQKVRNGNNEFYNSYLIDELIRKVIDDKMKFSEASFILNQLNMIRYINLSLLDYLSSELYENPSLLSTCHPMSISTLVTGLAFANYKPPVWNELQEMILKIFPRIPGTPNLIYFTLNLASLGCFDDSLLKHAFLTDQIPKLMSKNYHKAYQQLYQSVKTLYPAYSGPWPLEELIESFKPDNKNNISKEYPLQTALENIFGGPDFIQTNVRTNLGHIIDHLIILQDGHPISIQTSMPTCSVKCVEHFNIPSNTDKIAVLFLPFEAYGINIKRLKASHLLNKKSLESMSYKVVHIPEHIWHELPDHEILPYLKQEIDMLLYVK